MKEKKYLLFYYISFVATLVFWGFASLKSLNIYSLSDVAFGDFFSEMVENFLGMINLLIVIIFTIMLLKKRKLQVESLLFPIAYLVFFIVILVLSFLFNTKVMVEYMHFEYYLWFINIAFLLLNVYSLCLIKNK